MNPRGGTPTGLAGRRPTRLGDPGALSYRSWKRNGWGYICVIVSLLYLAISSGYEEILLYSCVVFVYCRGAFGASCRAEPSSN